MKIAWKVCLFLMPALFLSGCSGDQDYLDLKGPYLGQAPPGTTAELFDPGIFPEGELQGCSGFLKEGTVFVFSSQREDTDWRLHSLLWTELKRGRWTRPKLAPFSFFGPYNFTVGPDDLTLYFTTLKSPDKTTSMLMEQANIWAVILQTDGWGEPVMLGRSINTEKYYENYPAVTRDGTIYYMSRREQGVGGGDVFRSRNIDGRYAEAENVGAPVNSEGGDADPFVAPDESYLIVCQKKEQGFGEFDLYISFRKPDGSWMEPVNMGGKVNSSGYEFRPYVTPDGRYLFFTSSRNERSGIYWVDARIIADLKPDDLK